MPGRVEIDDVAPVVSCGAYPAKAVIDEVIPVRASVWREGHDAVAATLVVRYLGPRYPQLGETRRLRAVQAPAVAEPAADPLVRVKPLHVPMSMGEEPYIFHGAFTPDSIGLWTFRVDGWGDPIHTWRHAIVAKLDAGQGESELSNDLLVGAQLLERAATGVPRGQRDPLRAAAAALRAPGDPVLRAAPALAPEVDELLSHYPLRELVTRGEQYGVWVDRPLARFGSWYEMFPRSTGGRDADGNPVHGTFATAAAALPRIAQMGFDVVYLPPIHPIGKVHRKGSNNTATAVPGDVGSPWAIGSDEGGHDAVHPQLGTIADFDKFVAAVHHLGMEVALDLALQCAPDHPWASEHREWFTELPDGTIAYAENPPKKYQDIFPINFDNDPAGLYDEVLRVVRYWMDHGVKVFRVDNPHTKPPNFWAWLIGQVKAVDPDVLFLSEAFTPPARQYGLAKLGFTQSYTYFTWRTSKWELTEFGRQIPELADLPASQFVRQHPRHLACRPATQWPGHVRDTRCAGGDHEPRLGDVFRLRVVRGPRRPRGQRGISRLGEVRATTPRLCGRAGGGAIAGAIYRTTEQHSSTPSGTSATAQHHVPRRRQRRIAGLQQVRPDHRRLRAGRGDAQRVRAGGGDVVVGHARIGYGAP